MRAHDLAADWGWMEEHSGFRLRGGRVVWEEAEYRGERLRIGRVEVREDGGLQPVARYVDPETEVEFAEAPKFQANERRER